MNVTVQQPETPRLCNERRGFWLYRRVYECGNVWYYYLMIFIYMLLLAGMALGMVAVAGLALAGHMLEAGSLLGLVLISGLCGAALARRAPRSIALTFVGWSMALGLEVAGHMSSGLSPDGVWAWVFFVFALALGPFYIHFATSFPLPRPDLRWLVVLAYGVAGAVLVLGPLGFLGPALNPMHPLAVAARALHYHGGGHSIYAMGAILIILGMELVGLWVLWSSRRKASGAAATRIARQASIIILGTVVAWLPTIAFMPGVLPIPTQLVFHGPPALFFGLTPICVVVALIKPDFYDDRALFRRALIGIGLASGAFLLYLAILRPLTLLLDQIRPGFGHDPAVFGAALVVALLIRPIQGWMADQVDQLFFPHLLGFRTLLQETSQALATTIIPGEVAKLATSILPARLGVSGATLLVMDDLDANLISLSGQPLVIPNNHAVWMQAAYRANGPRLLREAAHCADLGLAAPALMLPLRVGGRLVGIYVLGTRQSAVNYTRDELGQLMVLGHHLAVAVENGRALRKIDALSQRALAEVEERNRLAREIHDTIAQGLTAASLQLDVVEATLTANPAKAAKATERAQSIVRSNLAEARRSVLELRAPLLGTESLPAAVNRLLNQAAGDIGAAGTFRIEGTYRGLPARVENQLYRIAQEALHNAVKYSSASHLIVSLQVDESQISLSITDNGAGFDSHHTTPGNERGGFGLTGMGERARLLAGELRIESEPGAGTAVEVIVPLRNREEESS